MRIPKLSSAKFTFENSAYANRVFLFENCDKPPFVRPVSGWKIVGKGKVDIPGSTNGFVLMFEKVAPLDGDASAKARLSEDVPEGTRIWQHFSEHWLDQLTTP